METLTAVVALAAVVVVCAVRPAAALFVFLAVLLLYPAYLRIGIGVADINASRFVSIALLLRLLFDGALLRRFHWHALDACVLLYYATTLLTLLFTTPLGQAAENRFGFAWDTLVPYFLVRLIVTDRAALVRVVKPLALILAALAVLGAVEMATEWSPYNPAKAYSFRGPMRQVYEERYGMARASGPFSQPIMFGVVLATLLPLVWSLRHEPRPWQRRARRLAAVTALGTAFPLSSGPLLQVIVVIGWLVLETRKRLVRYVLLFFALGCGLVEVLSNRHFYYVLAEAAFDAANGWYRARLIDVAVMRLPEYWACGYGLTRDPGWGPDIIGLEVTDTVNQYVFIACLHGLPGMLTFVAAFGVAVGVLWRRATRAPDPWVRSYAWALGGSLAGLLTVFWTVCIFGPMETIAFIMLALTGCVLTPQPAQDALRRATPPRRRRPANTVT